MDSSPAHTKVSLTGIKPTGYVHLGNYVGAIRPALALAEKYESWYFMADYHSLTSMRDAQALRHYTRSVAATWLACGLDPERTVFYRQSDVPEIFELQWVMSCVTGKGLMNRAHAYKAARDRNRENGVEDLDAGVNMGLYNYPVLMAVDILAMETDVVPVGRDQLQHVEYTADIAGSFNHLFGEGYTFKIPLPMVPDESTAHTLPGLDGRKMSKSYNNTIPMFGTEKELEKLIKRIKTDSVPVEEPKDPDSAHVFQIYQHFASPAEVAEVRARLEKGGMGWGEAKKVLFDAVNAELSPLRARYNELMTPGNTELDEVLATGAVKARKRAGAVLSAVRRAVGVA
ncbi:MAG: tryptophan--tRNA ligase [Corynebacteriales bacterium]|nr:tryptophan--tRNA ligase [Mycobacteriales bacterium]